jgi:hypothetical protein
MFRGGGLSQSRKFFALGRGVSGVLARNTVRYLKCVVVGHHCRCGRRGSDQRGVQVRRGIDVDCCSLTWGDKWDAGTRISGDERYTGHKEVPCHSQS